ncbi:hypothetical protein KUTeg_024029 [Tegillarca granosa]|uniref:Uncharacterized protein n=1 Tax=Tegillarca granosa TaxID=220873 RepID=A0ABQ9DW65_TEGGR|nr:hypothetical protein KUTeg_024029 [Tegillarca granosa]
MIEFFNMSCINDTLEKQNLTYSDLSYNLTQTTLSECDGSQRFKTPSEEYFSNYVLGLNEVTGFEDIGDFSLKLIFALVVGWIVIFLCLKSGIKTSGKLRNRF